MPALLVVFKGSALACLSFAIIEHMVERVPRSETELSPELVRAYADTFIPRYDLYPIQLRDGRYVTVKKPLELSLVYRHLRGALTLGAYALSPTSMARWICLDADDEPGWQGLMAMAGALSIPRVPAYLELSRRGGHLWLFFEQPVPGGDARRFGQQLLRDFGVTGVELYPKQDALRTGPGSLVRLPLGRHRLTGQRYPFVDLDGNPLACTVCEQVRLLASPQPVPRWFLDECLASAPATPSSSLMTHDRPGRSPEGELLSERLKQSISVYDFVGQYVTLDERGRGHCPFHEDEHQSFSVNREGNYWHCFAGCGGGSLIDFWMKWRERHGQDPGFVPTITELAEMLL
jgi:hypothetical protein